MGSMYPALAEGGVTGDRPPNCVTPTQWCLNVWVWYRWHMHLVYGMCMTLLGWQMSRHPPWKRTHTSSSALTRGLRVTWGCAWLQQARAQRLSAATAAGVLLPAWQQQEEAEEGGGEQQV
jgi:hypothetical protein